MFGETTNHFPSKGLLVDHPIKTTIYFYGCFRCQVDFGWRKRPCFGGWRLTFKKSEVIGGCRLGRQISRLKKRRFQRSWGLVPHFFGEWLPIEMLHQGLPVDGCNFGQWVGLVVRIPGRILVTSQHRLGVYHLRKFSWKTSAVRTFAYPEKATYIHHAPGNFRALLVNAL